ncbi:MAG TPA: beta-propeller fold lactonase family protein [Acidobacteriaceae bacterium]|nr:beta-propeller fold lactonase family protein [Acidobacteriaceae bacterium]
MRRFFRVAAAFFLLGCFVDCSNTPASPVTATSPIVTPKGKFAYTGNQGGSLSGYSIDTATGALSALSGFPFVLGLSPTITAHDPQNRFLIAVDNSADLLHVFAIDATTGALKEISPSPYITKNEPGTVIVDPSGTHVYLYVTGQNVAYPGQGGNQVDAYNLSSAGVLTAVAGTPFLLGTATNSISAGTPAMVTDLTGKFLYLLDGTNLYAFGVDANSGALSLLQTISGYSLATAVALDPAGKYLYATGAATNSIGAYGINPASGTLTQAKTSAMLEHNGAYTISVSPNGRFAYTIENNNDLVSYAITDGSFTPVGNVYAHIYGQQIAIDPSSSFLYVPQACSNCPSGVFNVVHEFSIDSMGALTPIPGSPVAAGVTPWGITVTSQ